MAKTPEQAEKEKPAKEQSIPFARVEQSGRNEALSTSERLNGFIQNNRRTILTVAIGAFVLLAGFVSVLVIKDTLQTKALARVEDFKERYETLRIDLAEASKEAEVNALVDELSGFASKHSGYAAARGYAILGNIYADKKDWEAAENAWAAGAKAGAKTYLAAVSLFNAAVAAEERGNIQGAIDLYAQSAALGDIFPAAGRAQFQIGRLEESRNNRDAAIQAYRDLINKWPDDAGWGNLAQSRIISLTLR
ncbi:MAG: tetratricopeptide repeat protein [Treponema sp.]|jgi:tetratricopeptide (TPR) repeat protein|nr:tetratricopeptide repeat protein [Treponema sp.]